MKVRVPGYLCSLPERALRASAAFGGGLLIVAFDVLVPAVLKSTTVYRLLIGDGLRFAVERVAGMRRPELTELPRNYQQRKLIGGAIEGLGLIALHFSPLWLFAIASDAAAGSRVFLERLVDQLREQGVIADNQRIEGLADLLDALQNASHTTVSLIDLPPLSRPELDTLAAELRRTYAQVFQDTRDLMPRMEQVWRLMHELSATSPLSIDQLARFMASEARALVRRGQGVARAVGITSSQLFGERVLQGYERALADLRDQGGRGFFRARLSPYLHAAHAQFQPDTTSWTQRKLFQRKLRAGQGPDG